MILAMQVLEGYRADEFAQVLTETRKACAERENEHVGPVAMRFLTFLSNATLQPVSPHPAMRIMLREQEDLLVVFGWSHWIGLVLKDTLEIGFRLGTRHAEARAGEITELIERLPDPEGPAGESD